MSRARAAKRKCLAAFLTGGFPSASAFLSAAQAVCDSGIDILEIGFPHSDPLADGPVIQRSSHLALSGGFTTERGLAMVRELASAVSQPIVIMGYVNPILRFGVTRFVHTAARAGVSGLIVPDLPLEESHELRAACRKAGIDLIYLVTPTTPPKRAKAICSVAAGFVYFVSVTGVTGARSSIDGNLRKSIAGIRRHTDLPVCVGFGISSAQLAAQAGEYSDGVIIGSKLLQIIDSDHRDDWPNLRQFLTEVRMQLGDRP